MNDSTIRVSADTSTLSDSLSKIAEEMTAMKDLFTSSAAAMEANLDASAKQAEVVKQIYAMFLKGMTPYTITRKLTEENIKTPAGRNIWSKTSVRSILTNEK